MLENVKRQSTGFLLLRFFIRAVHNALMYFFDFWIIFFPLDDYFSSAIQAHSFISLEMGRNNGVLAQDSAPKPIQGAQV